MSGQEAPERSWRFSLDLLRAHVYACLIGWPPGWSCRRELLIIKPCGPLRIWGLQYGRGRHHAHISLTWNRRST